jgi:hypothetical protein
MLTAHHKQNKQNKQDVGQQNETKETIKINLRGINIDTNDVDIQTIENMLNCKTFADYFVEQNTCKICFTEQCQITLNPCGHLLCEKCSDDFVKQKHKCPFCNGVNVVPIKMYYV